MSILNSIINYFSKPKKTVNVAIPVEDRQSSQTSDETFTGTLERPFPFEFFEIIDQLILKTPDLSQAVKKTIQIGNSGHRVEFDGLSQAQSEKAQEEIQSLSRKILKYSAGMDNLVNLLFRQAITKGAISIEIVPSLNFDSVEKIVFVPLKRIRFIKENGEYIPVQDIPGKEPIVLNPEQYIYIPLESEENSPYGIPPFISALKTVFIQEDGVNNLKSIVKKFGLLGFIFAQKRIPHNEGKTEYEYKKFLSESLKEFSDSFRQNFNSGVAVSYDDVSINHNSLTGDARGVSDIFQLIEQQIASGIDIDPALLGRTYSTTETYAGVVYHAFLSSINNTRRLIKRALEKIFLMHLIYLNYPVKKVKVIFNPDKSLNPEKEATAEKIKIENVILKINAGLIDRDTGAKELGYRKASGLLKKELSDPF